MLKKFIKDCINIMIVVVTFTITTIGNVFAVADYPIEQTYKVTQQSDGVMRFESSLPNLKILPWIPGTSVSEGDLSIELGNPLCLAYIGIYSVVMYAGDLRVKAAATAKLLAAASIIYGIAAFKYKDFEICGADWLVWGSYDEAAAGLLQNIREHYPVMGPFKGSRKYEVINCMQNPEKCIKRCKKNKECFSDFQATIKKLLDDPEYAGYNTAYQTQYTIALNDYIKCIFENQCVLDTKFLEESGGRTYLTINDRVYRERVYDGEEIANTACTDPREEAKLYDVNQERVKAGKTPYQLYYMRGFAPGNYACDRFLIEKEQDGDKFDEAYKCCINASNSVCIKDKMSAGVETRSERAKFCKADEKLCTFGEFIIEIFKSKSGEYGKYCARTWSLCPYNFNIQKGTEETMAFKKDVTNKVVKKKADKNCNDADCATSGDNAYCKDKKCKTIDVTVPSVDDECFDEANNVSLSCQGKIKNFYQYNRHCTTVDTYVQKPKDDTSYPPFIDKACINFVGSSHNTTGYGSYNGYERMFSRYKSFTAPIAECLSETLKNFLFNRAGHTKCLGDAQNPNEKPDFYGKCKTGYVYIEGDDLLEVKGIVAPASKLLGYIHNLIMLAVTLMITLYGYNILINSGKLERHDVMIMMLKVVIVITFSASSWWYDQLFRFTYGFSNTFSALTAKIGFDDSLDVNNNYIKYDGCYFGDINDILNKDSNSSTPNIEDNNYIYYPANRRYIAFFDSLDCKIVRYLGYGVGLNAPNLIMMLGASFIWPFNIGIYLAVGTLMMALFVINFAIKAVYMFVGSAIGIAIMLYVSPLIIPCILFKKTKGIFDKWLKNLLSFTLQPMVLFAFVSMSLTIMDKYTLGEGIYTGTGIDRELVCGYSCKDGKTGEVIDYTDERSASARIAFNTACGQDNDIIDLKRRSVACFLSKMTTNPWTLLQSLGLFFPLLTDIMLSDVVMFLRVAFLFFVLTKVLDTIPGIAGNLTGGRDLPKADSGDPFVGAKKLINFTDTVKRGTKNLGQKVAGKLKGMGKGKGDKGEKDENGDDGGEKRDDLSGLGVKKQGDK